MKAQFVHDNIDEGLLSRKKPKRITDGFEMDWLVNLIDMIEDRFDIDRDEAISIVEDNIEEFREYFIRRYNTYKTFKEFFKNKYE